MVNAARKSWQEWFPRGIQDGMGKKKGECKVCDRSFELDVEGNVPSHTKAIVGECCGSNVPAMPYINSDARRKMRRAAQREREKTSDPVNEAIPTPDDVRTTGTLRPGPTTQVTVVSGSLPGLGRNR